MDENEARDRFVEASTRTREALTISRHTQESLRATRRRVRLQGLIMSWRGRRTLNAAVQSERLALVLDVIRDEVGAPMGNIQLYEDGVLCIRSAAGLSREFLAHFAKVAPGKCCCGAAFKVAAPVIVEEIAVSSLFEQPDRKVLLDSGIAACQSLALHRDATTLGVISLHYREPGIPTRRQTAFTLLAADIAEAVSLAIYES